MRPDIPEGGRFLESWVASLLYHEVTDTPEATGFQRPSAKPYKMSLDQFAQDLELVAGTSVVPRTLDDLGDMSADRSLLFTFDDGGESALDSARLLEEWGWRGHYFITTSKLGRPGWMSERDMVRLGEAGHCIGSHSHRHPDPFRALSYSEMMEEWCISKELIENVMGVPCVSASVPGGACSSRVIESAEDAGFKFLFTSDPSPHPTRKGAIWVLGRYCLKKGTPRSQLRALLSGNPLAWTGAYLTRRVRDWGRTVVNSLIS